MYLKLKNFKEEKDCSFMKLQTRFEEVTHGPVLFPTGMFANTGHVLLLSLAGGQGNLNQPAGIFTEISFFRSVLF